MWWAYPLLWLVPLLTWMMVITRIRNIAEHAVVPDSDDPLRNTRTTRARLLERAFIAPYYVNYHLEHHLLFYVPCYNLPRVHRILIARPLRRCGWRCSRAIRRAAARPRRSPPTRIARGALVNNVRRSRTGAAVERRSGRLGFLVSRF